MSDKETRHPSALNAKEREELRKIVLEDKADTEGADLNEEEEEEEDQGNGGGADDEGAEGARGAGGADDQGDDAGADDDAGDKGAKGNGKGAKGESDTVEKKQFDGVLAELRSTREELKALKQVATGKREALPERNFDAEDQVLDKEVEALDKRYDEVGDLTDDEYRKELRAIEGKRRALDRDRNKYELHAHLEADRAQAAEATTKQAQAEQTAAWDTDVKTWEDSLGAWFKNPVRRATVEQTLTTMNADPELAKLSNAEFLGKLDEYLGEAFPDYPRTGAASSDKGGKSGNKQNDRQRLARQREAEATGAPPRIEGGVGNRGTQVQDIDPRDVKLGQWGKIPKAKRNEMLGID